MEFPPELVTEIQTRLDRLKELHPNTASQDRKALHVDGSIGYDCYVTPDGDVFMETYDLGTDEPSVIDRSRAAQIAVFILGSRTLPMLAKLLPNRPPEAPACATCNGTGWIYQELFRQNFGNEGILCNECSGLGWIEVS